MSGVLVFGAAAAAVVLAALVLVPVLGPLGASLSGRVRGGPPVREPGCAYLAAVGRRGRLALAAAGGGAAAVLGGLTGGGATAVGLGLVGAALPGLVLGRLRRRRQRRLDAQLVDALEGLAGALRAGGSLVQALGDVASETPPPLGRELRRAVREARLGVPPSEALLAAAGRTRSETLHLAATAVALSRRTGGNTAELFERLAETLRERFRIEGRIEALTSQGRMQGWVVALMPPALGLALHLLRPDLVAPMLAHPFGVGLVLVIGVAEALGLWMIRRIVDIEV